MGFSPRTKIVRNRRRVATHGGLEGFQSPPRDERGWNLISAGGKAHRYPRYLAKRDDIYEEPKAKHRWSGSANDGLARKIPVEQVTLLKGDFMFDHERPVFFLAGFGPVVFALRSDIRNHFRNMGFADGERRVAVLPCETAESGKGLLDPRGRSAFYKLHRFADRCGRGNAEQKMNVVFDSADREGFQAVFAGDASDIRPDAVFDFGPNPRLAIFCAENDMAVQCSERIRHEVKLEMVKKSVQGRGLSGEKGGGNDDGETVFNCRYATRTVGVDLDRGLKPTATFGASLCEAGSGEAVRQISTPRTGRFLKGIRLGREMGAVSKL